MADDGVPGERVSEYLAYLPAVYQQDDPEHPNNLGRFLLAFEHLLTGLGDPGQPGIEEILDGIGDAEDSTSPLAGVHRHFDPGPGLLPSHRAPREFLPWLAGWVALALRDDIDEERQRQFIASAVRLYRNRGTRESLTRFLEIYTALGVTIDEQDTAFQIGVHSTIGVDTILDGGAPHFFRVVARLAGDPAEMRAKRKIITSLIDLEKPAHTYYVLEILTPELQIGVHSTIGVDTLLGLGSHPRWAVTLSLFPIESNKENGHGRQN